VFLKKDAKTLEAFETLSKFLLQNLEVSKKVLIFAGRNKNDSDMNAVSMNNLWTYLQGLSLTASNRKWLAERLVEPENKEVMSDQEIKEGLTEAFSKLDGLKQGNVKTRSAEELLYELQSEGQV
jgi:hypothetical protein